MEVCTDFVTMYISVLLGYWLYIVIFDRTLPGGLFYYGRLGLAAGVVGVTVFYFNGLYRHQASMMNLLETRKLIKTIFVLFLFLTLYSYLTKAVYSRLVLCFAFCLFFVLLLLGRFMFFKFKQYLYLHGVNVRCVLIFGAEDAGQLLFQTILHTPKLGFKPVGFVLREAEKKDELRDVEHHGNNETILCVKTFEQCREVVEKYHIHDIFLNDFFMRTQNEQWQHLLSFCRDHQIQLHYVPYLQHVFAEQVTLNEINGIPFVSFSSMSMDRVEQIIKRCFDLVVGGLLTVLFAPLMAFIAVLIKRDSEGPVLFKQKRIGKNGELFTIYKFRTMYVDTPDFQNSPMQVEDSRITKIGRLLRKTSLDELSQIFNVLQGTMSLVGPRPEMPFIVENEYTELHKQRFCVKPGITGVWQISTDRTREIHEDISYDLFYIANRSLLLDILIICRTLPAIFYMRTC